MGIVVPRGPNFITLVQDVQTNTALQLPTGSVPLTAQLCSVVPFTSAGTNMTKVQIAFLKNLENMDDYVVYNYPHTLMEVNNTLVLSLLEGFPQGHSEYMYAALLCSEPEVTGGSIKIVYQFV